MVRDLRRIRGSRREHGTQEKPKEAEMEVDGEVPQEESFEIQSPKRKATRAESEVTRDSVRADSFNRC